MMVVFIFILGLFVGSFLNVVVLRLHRQESFVKGYSKCLFCGHRLYARDLVPLFSYLQLRGKCRYCKHGFSAQYPMVELATGLTFALVFTNIFPHFTQMTLVWQDWVQFFLWLTMTAFLIIVFIYDLKYYLILDVVVIPAAILAFIFNMLLGVNPLSMLLAAVVGGGFFLIQYVVSKGKWIGGGDIRLGFLMGIILGWPQILTALFIAYVLGSLISVGLLLFSKKHMSDKVPFGTFLAIATFLTMLYGQQLVHWYMNLFN
ncbi:prepilin peptidase [Candidatus Parcubacteria bacterium]|jgi:prepilin signal peptidase PulO-like enzyme (type II secretory pathway)|nr:prepilin peptidase [Candidatus Parcubacteria bacterium]MBT7228420.1 prepilin peptidase [Candidatus Parcubacteria bacterium]